MSNMPGASSPRLALVTCERLGAAPADERLLEAALRRKGVETGWVAWDHPSTDWSGYDGVLIRTAWDYTDRVAAFRQWARAVGRRTTLWNPAEVVAWNSHKGYLLDLAAQDVPIVPTRLLSADKPDGLDAVLAERAEVVVKPAVGAGASGTSRWSSDPTGAAGAARTLMRAGNDVLVQPFIPDVARTGETSLVFVDGDLVHAVAKMPATGDYRSQPEHGGVLRSVQATPAREALGQTALAGAARCIGVDAGSILYARVDCVDLDGEPRLMELELIEPDLFFALGDGAAERLARAVRGRLRRTSAPVSRPMRQRPRPI